jgi:glutamate synthase (NADPH/NADH) small chain
VKERVKNFDEVVQGMSEEEAVEEAKKCVKCKEKACVCACPVGIDVPSLMKAVAEKRFEDAGNILREMNWLPSVCARLCNNTSLCESKCEKDVKVCAVERFVADNVEAVKPKVKKYKKGVAVVGSGPAGLSCAASLALKGYPVTVYEALHKIGGVLRYGIPAFRLPKKVLDKEIEDIEALGVKIIHNSVVGRLIEVEELAEEYKAVFIATGASSPSLLGLPGENIKMVYTANEFLTKVNLLNWDMKRALDTVIIGGGDCAIDAARIAKRFGSDVTIVYRRGLDEMNARKEELRHAQEEGVKFFLLTAPIKIVGSEFVEGVECVQMMLGEEDAEGRKVPIAIEDSEFIIPCQRVVVAVGQGPNLLMKTTTPVLTNGKGNVKVNDFMQTSMEKVFAGGAIVTGAKSVANSISEGNRAAFYIDRFIRGKSFVEE